RLLTSVFSVSAYAHALNLLLTVFPNLPVLSIRYTPSLHDALPILELVKTAEEALSRAAKSTPGLVLLDIHMPTVSGLEVLKQLRGMDVRIILLTANESAAIRSQIGRAHV